VRISVEHEATKVTKRKRKPTSKYKRVAKRSRKMPAIDDLPMGDSQRPEEVLAAEMAEFVAEEAQKAARSSDSLSQSSNSDVDWLPKH